MLLVASFAVAAYTVHVLGIDALWNPDVWWQSIAVWFVGAALAHDLLLYPLFAGMDRALHAVAARRPRTSPQTAPVPVINYVRIPLLACGLITLMFFPGIVRQGADTYNLATGQTQEPFLQRWLILCAVILLAGVLAYLTARLVANRRGSNVEPDVDTQHGDATSRSATGADQPPPRVDHRDDQPQPDAATNETWRLSRIAGVALLAVIVVLAALRSRYFLRERKASMASRAASEAKSRALRAATSPPSSSMRASRSRASSALVSRRP